MRKKKSICLAAVIGLTTVYTSHLMASAFAPGDLALEVIGDGTLNSDGSTTGPAPTSANSSQTFGVYIDEYTPTGTFVQAIPVTNAGSNLLSQATTSSLGQLNLSADGKNLVLTGYQSAVGSSTPTASTNHIIGVVNAGGAVNTSTVVPNNTSDAFTQPSGSAISDLSAINGAAMDANGNIWFASTSSDPNQKGIMYTTLGSTSVATQIGAPNAGPSPNAVGIYNGNLYMTQGAAASAYNSSTGITGSNYPSQQTLWGVAQVGTGLPTTPSVWSRVASPVNGSTNIYNSPATTPVNLLSGFPTSNPTGSLDPTSPQSFTFADGGQTLYLASINGLEKWVDNAGTWTEMWHTPGLALSAPSFNTKNNTITPATVYAGITFLTSTSDGTNNYIYAVSNASTIYQTDTVPSDSTYGQITPGQSVLMELTDPVDAFSETTAPLFTAIADAPTNTLFRGIALAPVPEPTSLCLLGLGATGLLSRRRRI